LASDHSGRPFRLSQCTPSILNFHLFQIRSQGPPKRSQPCHGLVAATVKAANPMPRAPNCHHHVHPAAAPRWTPARPPAPLYVAATSLRDPRPGRVGRWRKLSLALEPVPPNSKHMHVCSTCLWAGVCQAFCGDAPIAAAALARCPTTSLCSPALAASDLFEAFQSPSQPSFLSFRGGTPRSIHPSLHPICSLLSAQFRPNSIPSLLACPHLASRMHALPPPHCTQRMHATAMRWPAYGVAL